MAHGTDITEARAQGRKRQPKPASDYTLGEEVANALTHGLGALLSAAGMALLVTKAVWFHEPATAVVGAVVFGLALVLEYSMSALYHAVSYPPAKRVLRTFDHSCIYLLIAGSYTPFLLVTLVDHGGVWMMVLIWAFALIGIGVEVFLRERQPRWVTILIYLVMGWLVVLRLPTLLAIADPRCLLLTLIGGLCYTVGTAFYLMKRIRYMHSVWHLWVMAGSAFQYFAVLLFVL